jgi:hypothetical protein
LTRPPLGGGARWVFSLSVRRLESRYCLSCLQRKAGRPRRCTIWPGSAEPHFFLCFLLRMQRAPSGSPTDGLWVWASR